LIVAADEEVCLTADSVATLAAPYADWHRSVFAWAPSDQPLTQLIANRDQPKKVANNSKHHVNTLRRRRSRVY